MHLRKVSNEAINHDIQWFIFHIIIKNFLSSILRRSNSVDVHECLRMINNRMAIHKKSFYQENKWISMIQWIINSFCMMYMVNCTHIFIILTIWYGGLTGVVPSKCFCLLSLWTVRVGHLKTHYYSISIIPKISFR